MKYRFSIIAPHYDDEFIGCREFIKTYGNKVDNITFVTNSDNPVADFPDPLIYITTRKAESYCWLRFHAPQADIHHLNVPGEMTLEGLTNIGRDTIFSLVNGLGRREFLIEKLEKIVGDNIVVAPLQESHPSHILTSYLTDNLINRKIFYGVYLTMKKYDVKRPGVYYKKMTIQGMNFHNYKLHFSPEEHQEKIEEFKEFYSSQYEDFQRTGLYIGNIENYCSQIPLKLREEDITYVDYA